MHRLVGAELIVDGEVAARAVRDEPRRALDRISNEARRVTLRLIFDDAVHPDFELDLWLPEDALRRDARPPAAAIQEARGWLARAEAILRRPAPTANPQGPPPPPAPLPQPAQPISRPQPGSVASYEDDPEPEFDAAIDDDPPWDEAPEADLVAEPPAAPPPPKPARPRPRKISEDGEPIPPLDEPIQPYLL
jgi:hypothetical protein